jgi:hypothetical protein
MTPQEIQALKKQKQAVEKMLAGDPSNSSLRKKLDELDNQIWAGAEEATIIDPTQMGRVPEVRSTPGPEDASKEGYGVPTYKSIPPKVGTPTDPNNPSGAPIPSGTAKPKVELPPDVQKDAQEYDGGAVPQIKEDPNNPSGAPKPPKINEVDLNPPKPTGDKIPEAPLNLEGLDPSTYGANADEYTKLVDTPASQLPKGDREQPPADIPDMPEGLTPPKVADTTTPEGEAVTPTDVLPPEDATPPTDGATPPVAPTAEQEDPLNQLADTGGGLTQIPQADPENNVTQNTTITREESPAEPLLNQASAGAIDATTQKIEDQKRAQDALGGLLELDQRQKEIVATKKEEGKAMYEEMKQSMDRIEMRDFVDGVVQSIATMLAGVVGLASNTPVGQYFKAVDVFDPTNARVQTEKLYDEGIKALDDSSKEQLAQLQGVFEQAWSTATQKERLEYTKALFDATKQQVVLTQGEDNKPDKLSASSSTGSKDSATRMKALSDQIEGIKKDKTYLDLSDRYSKLKIIEATGNSAKVLDPQQAKELAEWEAGNAPAVSLLSNMKKAMGEGFMEAEGGIFNTIGQYLGLASEPQALYDSLGAEYTEANAGEMDTILSAGAKALSNSLVSANGRGNNFNVPSEAQISAMMESVKDTALDNGEKITGQQILERTRESLKSAYQGGKLPVTGVGNSLTMAWYARNTLGIQIPDGVYDAAMLYNDLQSTEQQLGKFNDELGNLQEQYAQADYDLRSGGANVKAPRQGRVGQLQNGTTPNEVEFYKGPGWTRGWYGVPVSDLTQVKVDPTTGDANLPPAWFQPEIVQKVDGILNKHGIAPGEFFGFIGLETGRTFDTRVLEGGGKGGTGIIQFMPSTAQELLRKEQYPNAEAMTGTEAQKVVSSLSLNDQLTLVDSYFDDRINSNGGKDARSIYTAIFRGNNMEKSPITGGAQYTNNKGLDTNKDGKITYEEWTASVPKFVEEFSKMKWPPTQPAPTTTATEPTADTAQVEGVNI